MSRDDVFIEQHWLCLTHLPQADEITEQLKNAKSWQQRFSYLLALGKHLVAPCSELLDQQFKLQQCESGVWLRKQQNNGNIYYQAWSDAAIMRGLIVMLLSCQQQADAHIDNFLTEVN